MRKFLLFLLVFTSINAFAQKRLKSFSAPINYMDMPLSINGSLDYDSDGRPSQLSLDMGINYMGYVQNMPIVSLGYSYGENSISQSVNVQSDPSENYSTTGTLANGKVNNLTYNVGSKSYSYDLYYEGSNLVSIAGTNEDGADVNSDIEWDNGNISSAATIINGDSAYLVKIEYSDVAADPALNCFLSNYIESPLTDNSFLGLSPVSYYGLTCRNLPSKIITIDYDKEDDGTFTVESDTTQLSYTLGDDGYVSKVTLSGLDLEIDEGSSVSSLDLNLTWEDSPVAGISSVTKSEIAKGPDSYYSLDGAKLSLPRRGLNIIRHKDGSTNKVIIK